jgi:hypothetical protein
VELRTEPPKEIFHQYGNVLKRLAERGGWEQLKTMVEKGVKILKDKAAGKVKETLDYYTRPGEYWAGVAREVAFENASLTRFFLSWLSAYLRAVEGDKRAVADSLTANKAVADSLTAEVMRDGSIQTGEVTLAVGRFSAKKKKKRGKLRK